jgi:CHRD domain
MTTPRHFFGAALITAVFLAAGCSMMRPANVVSLEARLSGASEVPPVATGGMGTLEASLNKETNLLRWKVVYSGLGGPAVAAHFHGPASIGQNVGVVLGFKGNVDSPIEGEATLTPGQAADILAGKWYVNIHTRANPGGEIRGQVAVAN